MFSTYVLGRIASMIMARHIRKESVVWDFSPIHQAFDDDNDGFINREEWILGLSVFMKGTYNSETYFVHS